MRVVAYCPPHLRALVEPATGVPTVLHGEWPAFAKSVCGADCAVVVIERLSCTPTARALSTLRLRHPWTSFVLVTRMEADNTVVAPSMADSVVWLSDAHEQLKKAVWVVGSRLRSQLAQALIRDVTRSPWMKNALIGLLDAYPAPTTVAEWARLPCVSCVPRTLRKHFENELNSDVTPRCVVTAALLLYGLDRFPDVSTWQGMAARLDVDRVRLSSMAARLAGEPVRHPHEVPRAYVLSAFMRLL